MVDRVLPELTALRAGVHGAPQYSIVQDRLVHGWPQLVLLINTNADVDADTISHSLDPTDSLAVCAYAVCVRACVCVCARVCVCVCARCVSCRGRAAE